jgi:nitronate monooxygenase
MLHTRLCDLLGIAFPILSAPMGPDVSGPELVAAISDRGGLGLMQAQWHPPPLLRQAIRRVRQLTDQPFGVNFLLHFPCAEGVSVCVDERVPVVSCFWGNPAPYLARVHAVGGKVGHQVGSVAAQEAARAGMDVMIAQSIAAGGIADARGLVAAFALGAEEVVLGRRFVATPESNAHPLDKHTLVTATEAETVRTTLFGHSWPDAPHRTLRTPFVEAWLGQEARGNASRPDEPMVGQTQMAGQTIPVRRFMGFPRTRWRRERSKRWISWRARARGWCTRSRPRPRLSATWSRARVSSSSND